MRVYPRNTGTSAGLWVNRVSSVVEGWGDRTQSRGRGGACIKETAGCQALRVCVWMAYPSSFLKGWNNNWKSCCVLCIHKQNTEPWFKQKKSLWSEQGGGLFPGSKRTVTNRCYGNRFFDLQRSAGIKTTHTGGKGWHTTPWWPGHAATYSLLRTCLTESGVQIQSQHSRLRKVAKSKQGWNLIFKCFMRVNLYKT